MRSRAIESFPPVVLQPFLEVAHYHGPTRTHNRRNEGALPFALSFLVTFGMDPQVLRLFEAVPLDELELLLWYGPLHVS